MDYDFLDVVGDVSLNGLLDVSLIDSFVPVSGNTFDILDWGTLSGTFDLINLPGLSAGLDWDESNLYTTGEISVVPTVLGGDFDEDNDVDGVDFGLWQTGYPTASGATLGDGDADADGDVDGVDFGIWQANYPTNLGGSAAIPEPATLALVLIGSLALFRRRLR